MRITLTIFLAAFMGSRIGAVVRALASHQCGPSSIPGPGVICGLSLLFVLYSALRGFSPGTPVLLSPQKPTFPNSNSIWDARTFLNEFLWTPCCSMGKQITFTFFYVLMLVSCRFWCCCCNCLTYLSTSVCPFFWYTVYTRIIWLFVLSTVAMFNTNLKFQ